MPGRFGPSTKKKKKNKKSTSPTIPEISVSKISDRSTLAPADLINNYNDKRGNKSEYEIVYTGQQGDYMVEVYLQHVTSPILFIENLRLPSEKYFEKRVNMIAFYIDEDNRYAIATGQGWQVIQGYADPKFPQKIAARLLFGMVCVT